MATEKYNEIVFCKENYNDAGAMWNDIRDLIRILAKQNMDIEFYCDEQGLGIYCVHYNYRNHEYGGASIEWVDCDEYIVKEGEQDEEE